MKRIGLVGGLSPESTILYYKTIVGEYRRRFRDENYPVIIIYSVGFGEFTEYMRRREYGKAAGILIDAVKALYRAGADFALITANTPHLLYDKVAGESPIPLINIIDALAEKLLEDGVKRIGLLGTRYTLTLGFYSDRLKQYGIETIIPDPRDIEVVNRIIYDELVKGNIREDSRIKIHGIMEKLVEKGAEGIALACTELPLIAYGFEKAPIYDTARIHALKALDEALKD